ncbi:hypothetical protein KVT40_003264 [Elsinoe batatas]|uniref:Zn(2)-C6 fungal-type domain-containing protein n=1 Tax=Elsinoe batatas TaxID=2601811 RepID=A0A8K0PKZ7_9PEZI|nr:hypothetical protein KVT40_003264 [Elsinoe batatas]
MPRKGYKKSRFGCANCKRRHRRCDEGLPACLGCLMANDTCSYLLPSSIKPPGQRVQSANSRTTTPLPVVPASSTTSPDVASPVSEPATPSAGTTEAPNLKHLYLLSLYMRDPYCLIGLVRSTDSQTSLDLFLKYALRNDWFMSILLAFTALRKAIDDGGNNELHRQSMEQLDYGFQGFGEAMQNMTPETVNDIFLASGLISLHMLCDTFAFAHEDSNKEYLDRIIRTIRVMQGTRAVLREGNWDVIRTSDVAPLLGLNTVMLPVGTDSRTPHFHQLYTLIKASTMSDTLKADCAEAIDQLLKTYGSDSEDVEARHKSRSLRARAWAAVVSRPFTDLLQDRNPEALIILTHWGVLLHDLETDWPIGGCGRRIISVVEECLDNAWKEWIRWPREMVSQPV